MAVFLWGKSFMSEARMAMRMGTVNQKGEGENPRSFTVGQDVAPWVGDVTKTVPLEHIGTLNGMPIFFSSIADLYPGSRKPTDQVSSASQKQAYEAYRRFLEATTLNPGLKAHDHIELQNGTHVLGIAPRVFTDSTPVPYGLVIKRDTKNGPSEVIHLYLGATKYDPKARERFKQPLREIGARR